MNCEQYRAAIAADPSFEDSSGHVSDCAACQAYRGEILDLEQLIGRALALDVPKLEKPEFPEVIAQVSPELSASRPDNEESPGSSTSTTDNEESPGSSTSTTDNEESPGSSTSTTDNVVRLPKRNWASPAWLALAATVVVAAFLGIRLLSPGIEYDSLADEILAHLDHEPYALRVTDVAVSDARLTSVVPANVAQMDHSGGLITYAQSCVINGHEVPHLVIQGERGPVTILLMPEETISEPQQLQGVNLNGVILPVGSGSIAIIGGSDESLEKIQQQVLKSATWTT